MRVINIMPMMQVNQQRQNNNISKQNICQNNIAFEGTGNPSKGIAGKFKRAALKVKTVLKKFVGDGDSLKPKTTVTTYPTYDATDSLTGKVKTEIIRDANGNLLHTDKSTYINGNKTEWVRTDASGKILHKTQSIYDNSGKLVNTTDTYENGNKLVSEYNPKTGEYIKNTATDSKGQQIYEITHIYDDDTGLTTAIKTAAGKTTTQLKYDSTTIPGFMAIDNFIQP